MNTPAEYHRNSHETPEQPEATPRAPARRQVVWVRPTDLPSYLGPVVGRGIELQAALQAELKAELKAGLVRRARRTPAMARRTLQHRAAAQEGPTL